MMDAWKSSGISGCGSRAKSGFSSSERDPIQPLLKWAVNSPTNQNGTIGFDPRPSVTSPKPGNCPSLFLLFFFAPVIVFNA